MTFQCRSIHDDSLYLSARIQNALLCKRAKYANHGVIEIWMLLVLHLQIIQAREKIEANPIKMSVIMTKIRANCAQLCINVSFIIPTVNEKVVKCAQKKLPNPAS